MTVWDAMGIPALRVTINCLHNTDFQILQAPRSVLPRKIRVQFQFLYMMFYHELNFLGRIVLQINKNVVKPFFIICSTILVMYQWICIDIYISYVKIYDMYIYIPITDIESDVFCKIDVTTTPMSSLAAPGAVVITVSCATGKECRLTRTGDHRAPVWSLLFKHLILYQNACN